MKIEQLVLAIAELCKAGLANPQTKIEAIVAVGESLRVRVQGGETFTLRVTGSKPGGRCRECGRLLTRGEDELCSKCLPILG